MTKSPTSAKSSLKVTAPAAPADAPAADVPAEEPAAEPAAFEPVVEEAISVAADTPYEDADNDDAGRGIVLDLPILQEDEEAAAPADAEQEPAPASEPPKSRFADLKFGDDYDISKDTDDDPGFFRRKK